MVAAGPAKGELGAGGYAPAAGVGSSALVPVASLLGLDAGGRGGRAVPVSATRQHDQEARWISALSRGLRHICMHHVAQMHA